MRRFKLWALCSVAHGPIRIWLFEADLLARANGLRSLSSRVPGTTVADRL